MKFLSSNYNVGYPVYGAKFLNNHMLLVAGGGGEGNNGIPNKLTALRVDFQKKKVIKRFREITLDPNDDSPTTLDVANDIILLGCNENSEKIKSGEGNNHLRKFVYENEHLKFVAAMDFDNSILPEDYTKLIYISRDGTVSAIASSKVPTVIRIIDPRDLTEKYEIETGHEVKDMHFAPDGKVISYITASTLEVISIVTGRFIIRKTDFEKNYILSKIRFLTDDTVLIAASLKKGNGIVMIKISLKSGSASVLKTKLVTNKFKGVTSMDVDAKNQLAVIAGNDNSIALVKLKDFSLGKLFKQVHNFAITRVTFSPDSNYFASVSAANTVHIIKIPESYALSTSIWKKLWKFFINFVVIVILAILGQLSYKYDVHNKVYTYVKYQYNARHSNSSIANDIFKQTTLVGDIVSVQTVTKPLSTDNTTVDTSKFFTDTVNPESIYVSNSESIGIYTGLTRTSYDEPPSSSHSTSYEMQGTSFLSSFESTTAQASSSTLAISTSAVKRKSSTDEPVVSGKDNSSGRSSVLNVMGDTSGDYFAEGQSLSSSTYDSISATYVSSALESKIDSARISTSIDSYDRDTSTKVNVEKEIYPTESVTISSLHGRPLREETPMESSVISAPLVASEKISTPVIKATENMDSQQSASFSSNTAESSNGNQGSTDLLGRESEQLPSSKSASASKMQEQAHLYTSSEGRDISSKSIYLTATASISRLTSETSSTKVRVIPEVSVFATDVSGFVSEPSVSISRISYPPSSSLVGDAKPSEIVEIQLSVAEITPELEDKTPEPVKNSVRGLSLTTPTDSLVSNTYKSQELVPEESVSIETGSNFVPDENVQYGSSKSLTGNEARSHTDSAIPVEVPKIRSSSRSNENSVKNKTKPSEEVENSSSSSFESETEVDRVSLKSAFEESVKGPVTGIDEHTSKKNSETENEAPNPGLSHSIATQTSSDKKSMPLSKSRSAVEPTAKESSTVIDVSVTYDPHATAKENLEEEYLDNVHDEL